MSSGSISINHPTWTEQTSEPGETLWVRLLVLLTLTTDRLQPLIWQPLRRRRIRFLGSRRNLKTEREPLSGWPSRACGLAAGRGARMWLRPDVVWLAEAAAGRPAPRDLRNRPSLAERRLTLDSRPAQLGGSLELRAIWRGRELSSQNFLSRHFLLELLPSTRRPRLRRVN